MALTRFRLQTFGRLALFDPAGAEHALTKRRRQLAVLAYLSLANRPVSREALATMFWGEEAEDRARHSLSNTLSAIRGALGRSAIDLGRFEVALSADAPLDVDAREVARAAAAKDWATVVARVTGPFLDGVFVEGSNQFEDWLSAERRRVEKWMAQGCAHEAARLLEAGAFADAAGIADAWLAAAPLDTDAILARLCAEVADGSPEAVRRATALHERIVQRLRQEFGPRIDRRVAGFLTTIERQVPAVSEVPASLAPSALPTSPAPQASSAPPRTRGPTTATSSRPSGPTIPAPPRRRRAARLIVVLLVLAAVGGLAAVAFRRPARPAWVLVADLERGGGDTTYDGAIPVALGASLAQSRTTQVVSRSRLLDVLQQMQLADTVRGVGERTALEAATRIGADVVVVPTIAQVGDRMVLGVRVLSADGGGVIATERVEVSGDSVLLDAVDAMAKRVRRRLGESALALREVTPLPQATTASLPALRAYAAGLRAQEGERFAEAVTAYRAAIAFDSTFAQAHVALGAALASAGEADVAERHLVRAMALAERLPAREAMLVRRTAAMARRDWNAAVALGGDWLARFPRDREALDKQAYALFRARRIPEALDAYRRLLAVDSLDANAWLNFASALPFTDATLDEKMAAYGRATRLYPEFATGITVNHEIGGALVRSGRYDSAAVVFGRMLALDATHRARGHRSLGYLAMWRGAYGEAASAFGEAVTWQRATGEAVGEVRARLARARALRGIGRADEAGVELDSALAVTQRQRMDLVIAAWVGKALARAGALDGVAALQRLVRERRVAERPGDRVASLLLDAEFAMAQGNAAQGLALLDSLARVDSSSIVQESRAHAAFAAGRYEQAATLYARLAATPEFGWEGSEGTRLAPYWAARAAEALGDTAAARRGYAAFVQSWDAPDAGLVWVREARGRMGER